MNLDLDGLAEHLQVPRRYVRDNLVKRSDFPRPLVVSRYLRFWVKAEVDTWLLKQRQKANGRPRAELDEVAEAV